MGLKHRKDDASLRCRFAAIQLVKFEVYMGRMTDCSMISKKAKMNSNQNGSKIEVSPLGGRMVDPHWSSRQIFPFLKAT